MTIVQAESGGGTSSTIESGSNEADSLSMYLWPVLGAMLITVTFQGGLALMQVMEEPFGLDVDDLNSDWALMSSETVCFMSLTCAAPPMEEDEDEAIRVLSARLPSGG